MDEDELAKNYASILAYNFPDSRWYERSYNLIYNLNEIIDNEKWYEKYNPVKIFKQNSDNLSDTSQIQYLE